MVKHLLYTNSRVHCGVPDYHSIQSVEFWGFRAGGGIRQKTLADPVIGCGGRGSSPETASVAPLHLWPGGVRWRQLFGVITRRTPYGSGECTLSVNEHDPLRWGCSGENPDRATIFVSAN